MYDLGTKLVCINDSFEPGINDYYNALPKKGKLYVVRDVVPGIDFGLNTTCAILLVELVNKPNKHGIEPGFQASRFVEPEELDTYEKQSEKQPEPEKKVRERELAEV